MSGHPLRSRQHSTLYLLRYTAASNCHGPRSIDVSSCLAHLAWADNTRLRSVDAIHYPLPVCKHIGHADSVSLPHSHPRASAIPRYCFHEGPPLSSTCSTQISPYTSVLTGFYVCRTLCAGNPMDAGRPHPSQLTPTSCVRPSIT